MIETAVLINIDTNPTPHSEGSKEVSEASRSGKNTRWNAQRFTMRLIPREVPCELASDYKIRGGDVTTRSLFFARKTRRAAVSMFRLVSGREASLVFTSRVYFCLQMLIHSSRYVFLTAVPAFPNGNRSYLRLLSLFLSAKIKHITRSTNEEQRY